MKGRIGWALLAVLFATPANSIDYFVSKSGKDANSGRTVPEAWKSIARVNRHKFMPGDRILFQRGGVWREMLRPQSSGQAGKVITYGAYGVGRRPILSGSDLIPQSEWHRVNDRIYSYASAVSSSRPACVRQNGKPLQVVSSKAELSGPGEWWFDSASGLVQVFASLPGGLEIQVRESNIDNNQQSYITYEDFELKGARQGLRLYSWNRVIQGITLQNSVIQTEETQDYGTMSAGVYASVNTGLLTNIVVRNNEFVPFPTGLRNWGIYFVRGVQDFRIEGNKFGPAGEDAITIWHSRNGVIRENSGGGNGENTIDVKDSENISITRNEARVDAEYNIVVHSVDQKSPDLASNITVAANHCVRGGVEHELSAGIAMLFVRKSKVVENVIEDPVGEAVLVHDASSTSENEVWGNILLQTDAAPSVLPVVLQNAAGTIVRNNRVQKRTPDSP